MLAALFTFTDGRYIGAILDRNGLRPSRYYITKSNHMYMASEVGVTELDPSEIVSKVAEFVLNHFATFFPSTEVFFFFQGRLKPGRLLLVDTKRKIFIKDDDIKREICSIYPVVEWVKNEVGV